MQDDEEVDMADLEVAAIMDHRIVGGEPLYYIKWADHPTLEWMTEEGLADCVDCADLLGRYRAEHDL